MFIVEYTLPLSDGQSVGSIAKLPPIPVLGDAMAPPVGVPSRPSIPSTATGSRRSA